MMEPQELAQRIAAGTGPAVIDVRTGIEFRRGHIPGAIHAPVWKIMLGLARLPRDRHTPLVVLCELGPRAATGRLLLRLFGYRDCTLLAGHMAAWRRLGLPVE